MISLADARVQAQDILRQIQLGIFNKPQADAPITFSDIIPQFIDLYAKPRNRRWKSTQSVLNKFSALNNKPIETIKRIDVVKVLDEFVAMRMTTGANRALAAIKKLFDWCLDRGTIDANPLAVLKAPAKGGTRDRVLSDATYRFPAPITCEAVAVPQSLQTLRKVPAKSRAKDAIPTGERNDTLFRMACSVRKWFSVDDIVDIMKAVNERRCVTPLLAHENLSDVSISNTIF